MFNSNVDNLKQESGENRWKDIKEREEKKQKEDRTVTI